jgi:hypothetical protein
MCNWVLCDVGWVGDCLVYRVVVILNHLLQVLFVSEPLLGIMRVLDSCGNFAY